MLCSSRNCSISHQVKVLTRSVIRVFHDEVNYPAYKVIRPSHVVNRAVQIVNRLEYAVGVVVKIIARSSVQLDKRNATSVTTKGCCNKGLERRT